MHATTRSYEFGRKHDEHKNKVFQNSISEITMSFLDDILMKGCVVEEKDETMDYQGCRKFMVHYIHDCKRVLWKLEDVL